jgi:hypothetical protein
VNELLARYPAGIDELLLQAIKSGDVESEEYEKSLNIAVTRSEFDLAAFKPALMYTWGIVKGTGLLNSVGAYEAKEYLIQRIRKLQKECIEFPNSELLMELLKTAAEAQRGLDNIAVDDSQPCPTLRELLKVLKGHVNVRSNDWSLLLECDCKFTRFTCRRRDFGALYSWSAARWPTRSAVN